MHAGAEGGTDSEVADTGDSLSPLGLRLLRVLFEQPAHGLTVGELATLAVESLESTAEAIAAELLAGSWVAVAGTPPTVTVERWAAEWHGYRPSRDGLSWRPYSAGRRITEITLNFDPLDPRQERAKRADWARDEIAKELRRRPKDHFETITCLGGGYAHRERHRDTCDCQCCRLDKPPTGTRPKPKGRCRACPRRKFRANEECLECGRGGQDGKLPPIPLPADKTPTPPKDAEAKPETRKEKRAKKYGAKATDGREGATP